MTTDAQPSRDLIRWMVFGSVILLVIATRHAWLPRQNDIFPFPSAKETGESEQAFPIPTTESDALPESSSKPSADGVERTTSGTPTEWALVSYVPDGDSLIVQMQGEECRIRLFGIDAPEKGQPFADEARNWTRAKCDRREVLLARRGEDQYGRILADVWVAGEHLNASLVAAGLAWSYDRQEGPFLLSEEQARAAGYGLWQQSLPERPAEYRKRHPYEERKSETRVPR